MLAILYWQANRNVEANSVGVESITFCLAIDISTKHFDACFNLAVECGSFSNTHKDIHVNLLDSALNCDVLFNIVLGHKEVTILAKCYSRIDYNAKVGALLGGCLHPFSNLAYGL